MSRRSIEAAQRALGDSVREVRCEKGHSRQELAELSGVPLDVVARLEEGRERPTIEIVLSIALALDVPARHLCAFLVGHDESMARLARNGDLVRQVFKAMNQDLT